MKSSAEAVLSVGLGLSLCLPTATFSQAKRPITAKDCVEVRYLNPDDLSGAIRMNPQGTQVAYVVKTPNLADNRNDYQLYLKDILAAASDEPRLLATFPGITNIQWQRDGKHFSVLIKTPSGSDMSEFDVRSGKERVWIHSSEDIREYSVDASGSTLAFAAEVGNRSFQSLAYTPEQRASGFRVPPFVEKTSNLSRRILYLARRSADGSWSNPVPLKLELPFTAEQAVQIPYSVDMHLSMSPDGTQFLFNYINSAPLPDDWNADPTVRANRQAGMPGVVITGLYHLFDGRVSIPLRSAGSTQTPVWSEDGESYICFAYSPVGSNWAKEDERTHKIFEDEGLHMFWVRPAAGDVQQIPAQISDTRDQALLFWDNATHSVGMRTKLDRIELFVQHGGEWHSQSSFQLPFERAPFYAQLASDGKTVVGDYQATTTPPELYRFDVRSGTLKTFEILDPEFAFLDLAPVREIHWKTATGYPVAGLLLLPTHYDASKTYPLVIATKFSRGDFACDAGAFHSPSFAPQPIANAGMMYLMGYTPEDFDPSAELAFYPTGYPGGVPNPQQSTLKGSSDTESRVAWGADSV